VVCFINFNGINENQNLNIGHIINNHYFGNNYEYEALKALYNYGFLELGALEISATWTLADKEKLAPLEKLGMKVVKTFMANKFKPNPDGTTLQFEACSLLVTRDEWITNPAV
jgi:RimJ/RimL family protein N-acetyltransferase